MALKPFPSDTAPLSEVKILVAGGFGAGKTTLVGSISEIEPLITEEVITQASAGVDSLEGIALKETTTVAMDFGRITFPDGMILYLFGTPGQERFWFMWEDLVQGAAGAVVLADTRRLSDSFPAIDWFEQQEVPFIVAVNEFAGSEFRYKPHEVRAALRLPSEVPIVTCDARSKASVRDVLVAVVRHSLSIHAARYPMGANT